MRFAGTQLSNFMGDTTDFSQIAGTSQKGRSMERRAVMQGEGMVANAGVQSLGKMKSAEFQADSIIAARSGCKDKLLWLVALEALLVDWLVALAQWVEAAVEVLVELR